MTEQEWLKKLKQDQTYREGLGMYVLDSFNEEIARILAYHDQKLLEHSPRFCIGDEVWYAFKDENLSPNGYFSEQKIKEIKITEDEIIYITNSGMFAENDIGKTYFTSYEEAKKAVNSSTIEEDIQEERG